MKSLGILFMGIIILFTYGCWMIQTELLIDSFEGSLNASTVDFGAAQGSYVKIGPERELKVCGDQSMKLEYDLKTSGYMWVARGYNLDVAGAAKWMIPASDIKWSKYNAFSLYMYGSNSNAIIVFDIKDKDKEMYRFILDDDFQGWKEIICPFSEFFVRTDWQPEKATKNETLDFPIMSFQFEPRTPGKGVYYFDCVKLKRIK